ncbi:MAG TPA: hypothetical protein DCE42_22455 [Myxococcales bacterium]|nr:hypothetical protein [Myxococcales bacterium]
MSFYVPDEHVDTFPIVYSAKQPTLTQFHRALMDKGRGVDWSFTPEQYTNQQLAIAQSQWAQRAIAEYQSTAQFSQLLYRLTLLGAPLDMIGAATRLVTDECRHAELCANFSKIMGGGDIDIAPETLSLYNEAPLMMACAKSILTACCFGETLSVPVLRVLAEVSTDPLAKRISTVIAGDEEYHSRFGWEALTYFLQQMNATQKDDVQMLLPTLFRSFERSCHGSPEIFEQLVDTALTFEEGASNLGTLPSEGYAAIFYATVEDTLFPRFQALGLDPEEAWRTRYRTS